MKTASGGWNTTLRMHESILYPCIFGCNRESDNMNHYMLCPSLWSIVREATKIEVPLHLGRRLLLKDPTRANLINLTVAHSVYHSCKNVAVVILSI